MGRSAFGISPFHQVLTPRYVRYQRDRPATAQALLAWSAGNRAEAAGPLVDGAAVPSVSERQLRALSGGESGLADLLLTEEERAGVSAGEALRRAELALAALRRRWLAVVALPDSQDRATQFIDCISEDATDGDCTVNWTLTGSARCGFASDWCVGTGPGWGGVWLGEREIPQETGRHGTGPNRTSEATALASGAVTVLLQAYRDEDGRLTVPTGTVLKRLGATARRDIIDPEVDTGLPHRPWTTPRNVLSREEDMVRSLIRYAGASDDDLRQLIDTARDELNGTATSSAVDGEPDADDRLRVLNRFVPYHETIDTERIRGLLNAAEADPARANDLLAQLIRQIEWIDEQLRRRGVDKDTATDDDVRDIAITSLIGHGLIDLKAATDPAH